MCFFGQISIGYFITDLVMILWHFPALGGLEYVSWKDISLLAIVERLYDTLENKIYTILSIPCEIP